MEKQPATHNHYPWHGFALLGQGKAVCQGSMARGLIVIPPYHRIYTMELVNIYLQSYSAATLFMGIGWPRTDG